MRKITGFSVMGLLSGLLCVAPVARAYDGLAILGDSLSTGAATHPDLVFDSYALWNIFKSGAFPRPFSAALVPEEYRKWVVDDSRPVRLVPSSRENDGGSGWSWHQVSQAVGARTIEERRLSYGNFLGRRLGLAPENILIGGENGTVSGHAWIHAARLVESRNKDLPSRVIFLYSGNDLCAQSFDDMTEASEYGDRLLDGMKYLVLNGHPDAKGTKIYIPGFLPVTAMIHEPAILDRKINLHGTEVTCREAREKLFAGTGGGGKELADDPLFQMFSSFMPPSPVMLCPTLFSRMAEDSVRLSQLANRIRAYRDAQRQAVETFNQWRGHKFPARAFEAFYIEQTESLKFSGEDVAGDCFHLSAAGQGKVASALASEIK